MEPTPATPNLPAPEARLLALDLLRGLDMLLLTVVGPVLWAVHRVWALPPWVCKQLTHARWEGLTTWDLIMPLFIFMCGAAVPFAAGKHARAPRPRAKSRRVPKRAGVSGYSPRGEMRFFRNFLNVSLETPKWAHVSFMLVPFPSMEKTSSCLSIRMDVFV